MTKLANLALASALALTAFVGLASDSRLFEDKCNPTPKCDEAPVCLGCAPNKPQVVVDLEKCAYKNKPYNYYTYTKAGEKEVASDFYDWAASPEAAAAQ
jgi:hypothetical protein